MTQNLLNIVSLFVRILLNLKTITWISGPEIMCWPLWQSKVLVYQEALKYICILTQLYISVYIVKPIFIKIAQRMVNAYSDHLFPFIIIFFSIKYFQDLWLGLYYLQLFAILLHEYAIWWNTIWQCENSELILNVHVETTWELGPIPLSYWGIHVITGNCRWSQHYKT